MAFNYDNGFSTDGGDGSLLSDLNNLGQIAVGVKTGFDAASIEKKRLDVQAAQARADQTQSAAAAASSLAQNGQLLSILKIGSLAVAGLAIGFVVIQLIKGR